MRLKHYIAITVLFLAASTTPFAASYKGLGGQVEAIGFITGTFYIGQKLPELCKKHPALKNEAEETGKRYMVENKPVFDQVNQRIEELAEKNGGETERRRIKAEIKALDANEFIADMKNITASEQACSKLLSDIRHGDWDLKVRTARKIEIIME